MVLSSTGMRVDLTRPHTYHFSRVTLFCMEGTMWRERALKVVLVMVGLLFWL